jgi:hypothetical protein
VSLGRRALPDRVLRMAWSNTELLGAVEVFHFSQSPYFYVRTARDNPQFQNAGFNVFNLKPFKLVIVGAQVRVSIDSRDLFAYEQRFAAEIPVAPYARGGFLIRHTLADNQAARVRNYEGSYARIRIDGSMILRTPFGELCKKLSTDVVVPIDR